MKYVDVKEVFSEIPDEISLAISISGCPIHCKGCHSQYLWEDVGKKLDWGSLNTLIHIHQGITCVLFMGGDQSPKEINDLAYHVKKSTNLKVAWYSGRNIFPHEFVNKDYFDYVKLGPYDEKAGPLTSETTNQTLLKKEYDETIGGYDWVNITHRMYDKL